MPKRTESEILAEMAKAHAAYHEAAHKEPAPKLEERSAAIRALREELSALMSHGAADCPDCGNPPLGMRKNPAEIEIGCLHCPVILIPAIPAEQQPRRRREPRIRAGSVEEAVRLWNLGERIVMPDI